MDYSADTATAELDSSVAQDEVKYGMNINKSEFVTKFEDVCNQTTEEYFKGNQFSIDAFNKKYTVKDGETYVQAIKRVCDYIASAEETEEAKKYWSARWFDEIYNDWWHPAGSIMQGANCGRSVSLANCTTLSLGKLRDDEEWDNLESIIKNTTYAVAKCAAYRQGLGVDFSRIRPAKMTVLNSANESTGAVHWMKFVDSVGYYVGQKGRIPAMLFSISGRHPDVLEFITAKSDYTKIQNANISVQLDDDFYEAVENGEDYELRFDIPEVKKGQKVWIDVHSTDSASKYDEKSGRWYYISKKNRPYESFSRKVSAKYILELIAKNMFNNAEPGIQNIDIARYYSNSDYVYDSKSNYDSRILSTNACCVVDSTSIMTNNGWMTIGSIFEQYKNGSKNILAMSYNLESKRFEFKPIVNAWQQRNDTTVELDIEENGTMYHIECSSDHKILTRNRGYVEAASLTESDDIVIF